MTNASKKKIFALIRKVINGKPLSKIERETELPRGILEEYYSALPQKDKIISNLRSELAMSYIHKINTIVSMNSLRAFADYYKEQSYRISQKLQNAEPLIKKGQQFNHSPEKLKKSAKKGGETRDKYPDFKKWVEESGFDVKKFEKESNEKFLIAIQKFKPKGCEAIKSPKTADRCRKKYLSKNS